MTCSEESGDANSCNANCFLYHFGGGCLPTLTTTQCAGAYWLSDNTQCFVSAKTEADCQPPPSPAAPPPEPDARQCYVTVHVCDTDFDSEDEYVISTYMRPGGGGGRRLQNNPPGSSSTRRVRSSSTASARRAVAGSRARSSPCSRRERRHLPGTGEITITTTASDAVANTDRTHDGSLVHARHTLTAVSTLYATNDAEDPPVDATFTAGERKVSGTFKGLAASLRARCRSTCEAGFRGPEAFVTMTTANGVPFHEVCQTDQAETGDGGFYRCADAVEISAELFSDVITLETRVSDAADPEVTASTTRRARRPPTRTRRSRRRRPRRSTSPPSPRMPSRPSASRPRCTRRTSVATTSLTTHVNGRLHDAMCQTDQKPVDDRGFFVCAERVSLPPSETGYV